MPQGTPQAWGDGPAEMSECINCQSKTRSHSLFVELQEDEMKLIPSTERESTHEFAVCHSCYRDETPDSILETYTRDLRTHADLTGTSPDEMYNAMMAANSKSGPGTVYVGNESIKNEVHYLNDGDTVTINDKGPWAIVPTDEEVVQQLPGNVITGFVHINDERGGAIMETDKPYDDTIHAAYQQGEGLEFEEINKLEVHQ